MKNTKLILVNREEFVGARYARFLQKKKFLSENGLDRAVHLTDLDQDYGDGKVKDLVYCDHCNDNIADSEFIMENESFVYHTKCCGRAPLPPATPDNVINFLDFKEKMEKQNYEA